MSKYRNDQIEPLAHAFKALSHPQRLRIFLKLATCCDGHSSCVATTDGVRQCVGELGEDLGLAPSTVSHHMRELRQSGLIHVARNGQRIECWVSSDTVRQIRDFFTHELPLITLQSDGICKDGTEKF